jgi:hypothetical protein
VPFPDPASVSSLGKLPFIKAPGETPGVAASPELANEFNGDQHWLQRYCKSMLRIRASAHTSAFRVIDDDTEPSRAHADSTPTGRRGVRHTYPLSTNSSSARWIAD